MFVLDTNFLIYNAAGNEDVATFFREHTEALLYVPSIAVVEFLAYPSLSEKDTTFFQSFISGTVVLNLDYSIAELAGHIKREFGLQIADSIVAASTQITNSTLVTRNIKDFKKVAGLKLLKV